jgi:hypothetical protein
MICKNPIKYKAVYLVLCRMNLNLTLLVIYHQMIACSEIQLELFD